ncbi:MAG: sensor histidine kinase [Ginsengibacter sp.]
MYTHETGIYFAALTGFLVLLLIVAFFVVTIIRYQRKKVAMQRDKTEKEFNSLDRERERIAVDLHDDLGASLSTIKLRLQRIKNAEGESASAIQFSQVHIDQVMQKLRHISFNLMPGVLKRDGLDEALKDLIDLMTYSTNIKVNYQYNVGHFDKSKSLHIYFIAKEILNNTVKHAGATVINFNIRENKNCISLQITDNGSGFNKNKITKENKGSGLKNIIARTEILKARIYLTTAEKKGVDYLIEIPK